MFYPASTFRKLSTYNIKKTLLKQDSTKKTTDKSYLSDTRPDKNSRRDEKIVKNWLLTDSIVDRLESVTRSLIKVEMVGAYKPLKKYKHATIINIMAPTFIFANKIKNKVKINECKTKYLSTLNHLPI